MITHILKGFDAERASTSGDIPDVTRDIAAEYGEGHVSAFQNAVRQAIGTFLYETEEDGETFKPLSGEELEERIADAAATGAYFMLCALLEEKQ